MRLARLGAWSAALVLGVGFWTALVLVLARVL